MNSVNGIHHNDVLYVLQLMGDYVRAGKRPKPSHPVSIRLCKLIISANVFTLYCEEVKMRLDVLHNRYSDRNPVGLKHQQMEEFQLVLPQYDRLHSVAHGLDMWESMNPETFGANALERINQLRHLDRNVFQLLINKGLTRELAEDALIFSGRELIDPEMTCYRDVPTESSLLSPSNSTGSKRETDCFRR